LKQAQSSQFKEYQEQVVSNSISFAEEFKRLGYEIVSGGTDNHLLLLNLKKKGIDGARVERILELANIASNKNTVPGDKSALIPGGLRMGTPAMTTRGLVNGDFKKIANLVHEGIEITKKIAAEVSKDGKSTKLKDFQAAVGADGSKWKNEIGSLKKKVVEFCRQFPTVGFTEKDMKY
jgi:glycine hydroxymethyltransferase